jgi:hypothetical protein
MAVIGERLVSSKALATGAMTSSELAPKTKTDEHYMREWLSWPSSIVCSTWAIPLGRRDRMSVIKQGRHVDDCRPVRERCTERQPQSVGSRLLYTPCSRSKEVALCLGAQSGKNAFAKWSPRRDSVVSVAPRRLRSTLCAKPLHNQASAKTEMPGMKAAEEWPQQLLS